MAYPRPRGFLLPAPLSISLLSVLLHPPFLALARSGITWRTCMHACMQAGRHGGRMHACMHLEARMAQLAVQTGVSLLLLLLLSFSSFLRLAEERRTAAR